MKTNMRSKIIFVLLMMIAILIPAAYAVGSSSDPANLIAQLKFNESQETKTINDGFYLLGSNVTFSSQDIVPFGSTIYHHAGITRVFDSSGNQLSIINDADSKEIATPEGYSPATSVYQVPNRAVIKRNGEITQVIVNNQVISTIIYIQTPTSQVANPLISLPPKFYDWIEQADYNTISNLGSFSADWIAPSIPTNKYPHGAAFLFNGIMPQTVDQNSNETTLIQPVLEWNNGCPQNWCARPWFITANGGNYTENPPISVTTGDQINGLMTWNAATQTWTTTVTDNTISQSLSINDPNFLGTNNLKATCALEGQGVEGSSDIPGTTIFTNIQLADTNNQPVEFNWNSWINPSAYSFFQGLFVASSSQSQATLYTNYQYTITPSAGSGGSISPGGLTQVLANANQIFTITPAAGNTIANVQVDGTSVGPVSSYTFVNVTADHTISATFAPINYTITPSAGSGGTILPSTPVSVQWGQNQTFTIAPNSGYIIEVVQVDGTSVGPVSNYTFNNVTSNHTISAIFEPTPMDWNWSTQGWSNWQSCWSVSGTEVGPNSELGPEMVDGVGVFGTNTNLLAGSTQSSVWNTFTDPSGIGWNTLTLNGTLAPSDVPGGRWMTIAVNGQQVFGATEDQTPPGSTGQPFSITVPISQTSSALVNISQGQNPAWGPNFPMNCTDLILSNETIPQENIKTGQVLSTKTVLNIPNGSEWVGNETVSNINESISVNRS